MKRNLLLIPVSLILVIVLFACQKEISELLPASRPQDKIVSSSFIGRVMDEAGAPLSGVAVTAGGRTVHTNEHGIFRLNNVSVSEEFAYVKAEKSGYFDGSRTVIANGESANYVEIGLIKREAKGSFEAGSSTTIEVANGVEVAFMQAGVKLPNGTAYAGQVKVYGTYIDPEADNFGNIMPGDLRGVRTDGEVSAMRSYGMVNIELEGTNGEKLQFAEGSSAMLTMNIPPSLLANAPPTIPLWHFDESEGKWKEEGVATRTGNVYTGQVSHFTTWNIDVPENFVYVSLNLAHQKGGPIAYTEVKILDKGNGTYGLARTDSTGYLRMWVPRNAPLEISVTDRCNRYLLRKDIGSINSETDLGTFKISIPTNGYVLLKGTAVDCNGAPVTNGLAIVSVEGLNYTQEIKDGKFELLINRCEQGVTAATVFVRDYKSNKESASSVLNVNVGEYNAGTFDACEAGTGQYFRFKIGSEEYSLNFPQDSLVVRREGKKTSFYMVNRENPALDYTSANFEVVDTVPSKSQGPALLLVKYVSYSGAAMAFNIKKYGAVNDYIEVDIQGNMRRDSTAEVRTFQGSLRVRRRN